MRSGPYLLGPLPLLSHTLYNLSPLQPLKQTVWKPLKLLLPLFTNEIPDSLRWREISRSHTTIGRAGSRSKSSDSLHCRVSWLLTALLILTVLFPLCWNNIFYDDICGLVKQKIKLSYFCTIIMDLHELLGQSSLTFSS